MPVGDALPETAFSFHDLEDVLAGGTIERPLLTLDWRDVASLGPEALAVPQHRIEYVKYGDALVWVCGIRSKASRLDRVFASTGDERVVEGGQGLKRTLRWRKSLE